MILLLFSALTASGVPGPYNLVLRWGAVRLLSCAISISRGASLPRSQCWRSAIQSWTEAAGPDLSRQKPREPMLPTRFACPPRRIGALLMAGLPASNTRKHELRGHALRDTPPRCPDRENHASGSSAS